MARIELRNNNIVRMDESAPRFLPTGFRSWKKFWMRQANRDWPEKCRIFGCGNDADGSAHVRLSAGGEEYIIPACNAHINFRNDQWLRVNARTVAVNIDNDSEDSSEKESESSETEYETSETEYESSDTDEDKTVVLEDEEVKNINRTWECKPRKYSSWKKYWVGISHREWPRKCRIFGCSEPAAGGGHVYVQTLGEDVYIIPMCDSHNTPHKLEWFDVKEPTTAVRVDKEDAKGEGTCYRK